MNFILMKDSMVISDMLYILQHFNLNFIPFFIFNTVQFYNYCPTSPPRAWGSVIYKSKLLCGSINKHDM